MSTIVSPPGQLASFRAVTGTIVADRQLYYGSQTWNNAAIPFTAQLIDITDTLSNAASLLANWRVGGVSKFKVDKAGAMSTVTAILDQLTDDGEILTLRSTGDVAHGMTGLTDTATYGLGKKLDPNDGGLLLRGFTETTRGVYLEGLATTQDATRSTAAIGAVTLAGELKSGTSAGNMAADKNLVVIKNNSVTTHIFDTDGDSHQDVGTAWTNFDEHKDVELLNLLSAHVTRADDPLREAFGQWLGESREVLERMKLVTFNEDGHHFMNMSRLTMLHTGAIRQIGARLDRLARALEAAGMPTALLN